MTLTIAVVILAAIAGGAVVLAVLIVRDDQQRPDDLGHVSDRTVQRYEREADHG